MIEPIDPFERCVFDGVDVPPGTAPMDHFGLVEPDDRFGQRVTSSAWAKTIKYSRLGANRNVRS
jgi:hypothetical protein